MSYPAFIKPDHINKITADDSKFILEQGEKLLKEILTTGDLIISRTVTLLTLVTGLLVGLTGFVVSHLSPIMKFDASVLTAMLSMLYLLYPGVKLAVLLLPTDYAVQGASPEKFFTYQFFDNNIRTDDRIVFMRLNEIHNCQDRIVMGKEKITTRRRHYRIALLAIVLSPFVFAALFALIRWCGLS